MNSLLRVIVAAGLMTGSYSVGADTAEVEMNQNATAYKFINVCILNRGDTERRVLTNVQISRRTTVESIKSILRGTCNLSSGTFISVMALLPEEKDKKGDELLFGDALEEDVLIEEAMKVFKTDALYIRIG